MSPEERLTRNFLCCKCRGRTAVCKTIFLPKGIQDFLLPGSCRYHLLTCTLCGFTEFYDAKVYAQLLLTQPEIEKEPLPVKS
jgi:predicted nucleic-acid-binding Zn-ribbon protein